MKKLPIIGVVIAAIAAIFIKKKKAGSEPAPEAQGGAEDTSPPA